MNSFFKWVVLIGLLAGMPLVVSAQTTTPSPAPADQIFSDAQLDQMLGPIALYPDPLIAQILPASTFPTEIVLADRYVLGGGDPNQLDRQPWDTSVQAVAHYPSVLKWMDDNLSETVELGQAFLHQEQAVMASIQRLRTVAHDLGNLPSTPQQQVTEDNGYITITPDDPNEIYLPSYQPDQVYDDPAYGAPFITFSAGYPCGDWFDSDCDWGSGNILIWDSHRSHPDHGRYQPHGDRPPGSPRIWQGGSHLGTGISHAGGRGWGTSAPSQTLVRQEQEQARQEPQPTDRSTQVRPSTPVFYSNERPQPAPRTEPSRTVINPETPANTRVYNERPQERESVREISPAPAPRSEPSGGGFHSSGGGEGGGGGGGGGGGRSGGGGNHH